MNYSPGRKSFQSFGCRTVEDNISIIFNSAISWLAENVYPFRGQPGFAAGFFTLSVIRAKGRGDSDGEFRVQVVGPGFW
jgi:hypothetical protein